MMEVELTGQRGRVATRSGRNVAEDEKKLRRQYLDNQAAVVITKRKVTGCHRLAIICRGRRTV